MEYQNIINLLGNVSDKLPRYITKKNGLKFMMNLEKQY